MQRFGFCRLPFVSAPIVLVHRSYHTCKRTLTSAALKEPQGPVGDSSQPGYPLESPGPFWTGAAAFAYTFSALLVFADFVVPQQLLEIIYSIFQNHENIVYFGLFALGIHVGYVLWAIGLSKKRGYDTRSTVWWAAQCFYFGFLGVNMLLQKD